MTYTYQEYKSPAGIFCIVTDAKHLYGIFYKKNFPKIKAQYPGIKKGENSLTKKVVAQLKEYFLGKRRSFDLPLKFVGTPFQKKVWNALMKIPYGKTISYGEQALKIRNPKAVRAVGTSNGKNCFNIVVPCHRVIAGNGGLGGYGGGLKTKRLLLELEKR